MSLNPFTFVKRHAAFMAAGLSDRIVSRLSGRKVSFAKHVVIKIDGCEPWTDHFEQSSLKGVDIALKDKDFSTARALLALGAKEAGSVECKELANLVVDLIAKGNEITFELFTCLE